MNIHAIYGRISPYFRRRRLRRFAGRLQLRPQDTLLDIGGYPWCWQDPAWANAITLVNLSFAAALPGKYPGFTYVSGDACRLPFRDGERNHEKRQAHEARQTHNHEEFEPRRAAVWPRGLLAWSVHGNSPSQNGMTRSGDSGGKWARFRSNNAVLMAACV